MKNQTVKVKLEDGAEVDLIIKEVENGFSDTMVLILPAMGVKASYYKSFGEQLLSEGVSSILVDLRGLGTSSVRPTKDVDFGYLEMIRDIKVVIDVVKSKFPNRKIYGLGHSLGGQIASLAQAKYPNLMDGLILVAANSVYYKGWKGYQRYQNILASYLFPLISKTLGYFPGDKIGFGGKAAKTQLLDWGQVAQTGHFIIIGDKLDYEKALKAVTCPILAVYIEGDQFSPKAAMTHLYEKFSVNAAVTNFTLTRTEAGVQLNHFNWVKHGMAIVRQVKKWGLQNNTE